MDRVVLAGTFNESWSPGSLFPVTEPLQLHPLILWLSLEEAWSTPYIFLPGHAPTDHPRTSQRSLCKNTTTSSHLILTSFGVEDRHLLYPRSPAAQPRYPTSSRDSPPHRTEIQDHLSPSQCELYHSRISHTSILSIQKASSKQLYHHCKAFGQRNDCRK